MTWQFQVDAFLLLDAVNGVEKQVRSCKDVASLLSFTRQPDAKAAVETLCQGLEANSLWGEFEEVRLVARAEPAPMLAAFGRFTPRQRMLLKNLSAELNDVIPNHRYVDYAEAEEAAERLAAKLLSRYGREALAEFRFTAIPRGGWIVLGMLSYCLGLRHEQIGFPGDGFDDGEERTWVVVDDCALSGVRFRQFLSSRGLPAVIFCPLFAPAGLCEAIARAEPKVEACLNAVDLRDVAPERFGQAYPQWLEQRRARVGEAGIWLGITEYVAFAWCEPQSKFWDEEAGCYRASWNLLPPSLSLNRWQEAERLRSHPEGGAVERTTLIEPGCGPIREAPRVLWLELGDDIALAHFPAEPDGSASCLRLEGSAAEMWRCVLEHGTLDDAVSALLARYEVDAITLRHDLAAFVAELEKGGLLLYR